MTTLMYRIRQTEKQRHLLARPILTSNEFDAIDVIRTIILFVFSFLGYFCVHVLSTFFLWIKLNSD